VNASHVLFTDIARQMSLFAEGLAGRYLHVRQVGTGDARHAIAASGQYDGDSIELPESIADFDSSIHNIGVYRISVLRQIGYLNETTNFDLAKARESMPFPARMKHRAHTSDLEQFFAQGSRPSLLRRVFLLLESLRIDCSIQRAYPGARSDLDRVRAKQLAARSAYRSSIIESLTAYSLGVRRADLPGEDSGALEELLELMDTVRLERADVYHSASTALTMCAALDAMFRIRSQIASDTDEPQPSPTEADYISEPDDLDGAGIDFPAELIVQAQLGRQRGGKLGNLLSQASTVLTSGTADDSEPQDRKPSRLGSSRAGAPVSDVSKPDSARSYLYDEWDYHGQRYLRGWCRLYEQKLRGDQFGFIDDVHRRHALLAQQVRRQFGLMRPELWHRVRRTNDGDELELDAVIDAVIDRRTAGASDSQLYVRRDRALRDVAAAFLMDMSASTGFPLPEQTPIETKPASAPEYSPYLYGGLDDLPPRVNTPKRRVIDVAKDALALMCEALQRLGDSCAIYGFSGDGHERVEFHVAKDFADRTSAQTWAALAAMEPLRSTRMGTAIRHAIEKLARQAARMKVLIIVSDGYPQDHDYGPDRRDDNYGIEDTACALREAQRAGIVAFCVTIDPAGNDYLRRMCAQSRYMVIDDVMSLPRELTKIYRTLTQ